MKFFPLGPGRSSFIYSGASTQHCSLHAPEQVFPSLFQFWKVRYRFLNLWGAPALVTSLRQIAACSPRLPVGRWPVRKYKLWAQPMAFMLLLRETWGDVQVFALSVNMQVMVGARVITELGSVFTA